MPARCAAAPYTNLLQRCGVDRLGASRGGGGGANFQRSGDATSSVDREIGRVVVKLTGSVPTANSLRLPRRREDSLDAPGRFLYLQLKLEPGKLYAIHADLQTADRWPHRVSVSNLHEGRQGARSQRTGVQTFLPAAHDGWTLLALDLGALARQACRSPYHRLRSLQLCANMVLRAAFTSDTKYDWQTLPADLCFTAAYDAAKASVLWMPEEPVADEVLAAPPPRRPTSSRAALPVATTQREPHAAPAAAPPVAISTPQQVMELCPSPAAKPQWVGAFSGGHPGLLHWVPASSGAGSNEAQQQEIAFAAGSLVVAMQPGSGRQRYLLGHTRPVRALAFTADGSRLASAEEGPGAALHLWDFRQGCCLATVPGHARGSTCLDLSPDGALMASTGVDSKGRQELAVWDISSCWANSSSSSAGAGNAKPQELARQASDYNIQCLRFVPWGEPGRLVTAGKNSVRVHRLREGQLCGLSVPFDSTLALRRRPYSCGTLASGAPGSTVGEVFTCLGFERAQQVRPLSPRRLYAGALSGTLYTIDLEARTVEGVAQLHNESITALAVHSGGCTTGSADRLLRLWAADLQHPYMEAQHEGPVTGIGLSPDGRQVVVGTQSGALSLLDVPSQRYTTLLRSHTAAVYAVALMGRPGGAPAPAPVQYCTAGADGTVRIWDSGSHQQILELTAPGETVLSVACHPGTLEVACGFQGGILRVFDAGSTALVQESRQHSGAVTQLAFARHGRLLLSLGEDGCVCAYDPQRAYMPTSYLLAGLPLHATAMAASQDGRLLAVAALSMAGGAQRLATGSSSSAGASMARPVIVLHDMLTMQATLELLVGGSSPVTHLQLMPDARVVLAAAADGRLRGYRCADGGLVLDVPRCLPTPCLAAALDPSGTFLVVGSSGGRLKVLGLHPLHALAASEQQSATAEAPIAEGSLGSPAATGAVISSLPFQELGAPAVSSILGAAFLSGGRQLLTVGDGGEVCCWALHAEPRKASMARAEPADATAATFVIRPGQPAAGGGPLAAELASAAATHAAADRLPIRPVFNLCADCTASEPAAPRAQCMSASAAAVPRQPPAAATDTPSSLESPPAPRQLPAVLQQVMRPRPTSAPTVLPRGSNPPAAGGRQPSASVTVTPLRGGAKATPFYERREQPEASLVVTNAGGQRSAQVVRQEGRLQVTSPGKEPSCKAQQQRTAAWADCEVLGDRIPSYHPEQALHLLPPAAAVQRVHGFDAGASFRWVAAEAVEKKQVAAAAQQQQEQLLFAAGNVVVCEGLAAGQQRHLARLPRAISALAVSTAGGLVAAAVQPASGGSSGSGSGLADIHVLDVSSGESLGVLTHHSYAVNALEFSGNGSLLASLSTDPQRGSSLALWVVAGCQAELVAGVQLPQPAAGLVWTGDTEQGSPPTFYTVGKQGLTQWQLEPEAMGSTAVHMPAALRGVALTAVAWSEDEEWCGAAAVSRWRPAQRGSSVLVGDGSGRVWLLDVDSGQDVRSWKLLAELHGQPVTCLQAAGPLIAAGTADGTLLLLAAQGGRQQDDAWHVLCCEQLDGAVLHLQLNATARTATAASAAGTLWRVAPGVSPEVLLCGQQHSMNGWHLAQGATWKGKGAAAAVASAAGVAVWQLGGAARAPLVEFACPTDATHVALADDASCCAAACADGSVCLFDTAEARLRWRVAGAEQQGGVAALAVVQRLRGVKVMVAYRSGAVYVLEGGSGQVAHRTMQFAVRQDSGRQCPSNFPLTSLAVCPTDSAVFALCGRQDLVVCRAHWLKNAAVHPLARLSFSAADRSSTAAADSEPPEPSGQQQHHGPVVHVAFSRHEGHLFCTDPSHPGQLLLLDYTTQAVVKTLLAPLAAGAITALALHPKETLVAVGTSGGGVLLLRLDTEAWAELAAHAEGAPVAGLAFSTCGSRLFSAQGTATFEWGVA